MKKLLLIALVLLTSFAVAQVDAGGMMRKMRTAPIHLVMHPEVKKELKLSGEQGKKVDAVLKEYNKKIQEVAKGNKGQDLASGMAMMNTMNEASDTASKAVVDALNPDQAKRLKEIQFQINGATVLYEEETQKALELSEEQLGKIKEWKSGEPSRMMSLMQSGQNPQTMQKKLKEMKETEETTLMNILTPAQATKLKEMQGPPSAAAKKLRNSGF